ncbi:hypothetical protein SLEP1_g57626 [Rubroshorea leprosula]|uniref:DC1 domain-containing protein n=1 Tax=Rubroshorea leprosula TaxID=152421 RepID=A0AAV5MPN8_9ROSI|nr:hypothetical protein SLEP1_g57626 [Rubroshorea leprosula]
MMMSASCASDALKFLTTSPIKDTSIVFFVTGNIMRNAIAVEVKEVDSLIDARNATFSCVKCVLCCHLQPGRSPYVKLGLTFTYDLHQHPLTFVKEDFDYFKCNRCGKRCKNVFLKCSESYCKFACHLHCAPSPAWQWQRCALLPNLIAGDFSKLEHFSHQHSLFFIQNHYIEPQDLSCSACEEPTSGPVYCCFDCSFFLHPKCFVLPIEIKHPSHRKHSLTLLPKPPPHPKKSSCYLCTKAFKGCTKAFKGFIYYCSLCDFGIMIKCTFYDKVIKSENHEHPFILVSKPFSFVCNACGTDGKYCFPYVCTECDIAIHKDCISFPWKIKITRHEHPLSHIYFLEEYEGKDKVCRICWDEINVEYGSYRCLRGFSYDRDDDARFICIRCFEVPDNFTNQGHQHRLVYGKRQYEECNSCGSKKHAFFNRCKECNFFLCKTCTVLPLTPGASAASIVKMCFSNVQNHIVSSVATCIVLSPQHGKDLPFVNCGYSTVVIPGYGGGMSSAKAALESDTRVLAFEAGRKHKIRVNTISAGPLRSRAAKAIGFIDMMIDYSLANAPLQKELSAEEVGNAAAFLASPLASAITGAVVYVDNGLNAMGVGVDSPIFENLDIPKDK